MEYKSWLPLLVMAGFETVQLEENAYELTLHTKEDFNYLKQLFNDANVNYLDCGNRVYPSIEDSHWFSFPFSYFIEIIEMPIETDLWVKHSINATRGGYESGSSPDTLPLMSVEPHIRAIFSQIRRFGLSMIETCEGHDKGKRIPYNYPHLIFDKFIDARIAQKLICNSGFKAELLDPKFLRINESKENLMALGLKLSELRNTEDYYKQESLEKEERLIKLLSIPGTSGNEELVSDKVLETLGEITGTNSVVCGGNIQGELRKSTEKAILLSAHMDVYDEFSPGAPIVKQENCLHRPGNILGADDRAGIAIILDVLRFFSEYKNGYSIKYLFTASEEYPPHGVENVDPAFFENVEFALSLDRKGCRDIVHKHGSIEYSSREFAEKISQISRNLFGSNDAFSPCEGGISDLRYWSELGIESVNLSIGYSDEHTHDESLDLSCWNQTYELVLEIIGSEYEQFSRDRFHQQMNKRKP